MRGLSFSDLAPENSARYSGMPPWPTSGSTAMPSSTIPIPPSQWEKQRQSCTASESTSTSVENRRPGGREARGRLEEGVGEAREVRARSRRAARRTAPRRPRSTTTSSSPSRWLRSRSGRRSSPEQQPRRTRLRRPPPRAGAAGPGGRRPGAVEPAGSASWPRGPAGTDPGRSRSPGSGSPDVPGAGHQEGGLQLGHDALEREEDHPIARLDRGLAAGHERLAVGPHDRADDGPAREADVTQRACRRTSCPRSRSARSPPPPPRGRS